MRLSPWTILRPLFDFRRKSQADYARIVKCPESGDEFAILAFDGHIRDAIVDQFRTTYQSHGTHVISGGLADDTPIRTLLAGGALGSLGISTLASGNLFIATANPATLMAIGNGVGSAVMHAGRIFRHAPFIQTAGAIMPVVAPVLAFQALSTLLMLEQMRKINQQLATINHTTRRLLQRQEATMIGQALSACRRLEDLEREYVATKRYSNDMIIRLALVEDTITENFERYKFLYETAVIDAQLATDDLKHKFTDAHLTLVLSAAEIRLGVLRTQLTMQENAGFARESITNLLHKVEAYQKLWDDIEKSPYRAQETAQELQDAVQSMSQWKKMMPRWLGGNNALFKQNTDQAQQINDALATSKTDELVENTRDVSDMGKSVATGIRNSMSLVYWEDAEGRHSYYTDDIQIELL